MDPFSSMLRGDFAGGIEACTGRLREKSSLLDLFNRALGYLNLGEYPKALKDLTDAENNYRADPYHKANGHLSDIYRQFIGVTFWLMGKQADALDVLAALLQDHAAGRITYTDAAGGIESPCLAWFAGISLGNAALVDAAKLLLEKRLKSDSGSAWPAAIGQYLIERLSEKEFLQEARRSVPLRKRHSCQASFYIGALANARGDTRKALRNFRAASRMYALLEAEYYLAACERQKLDKKPSRNWWPFWR